mgnify:CR=1 FL=1
MSEVNLDLFKVEHDPNGEGIVLLQHGFLQNAFPKGVKEAVDEALQLLRPAITVTFSPDYGAVAKRIEEPTWVHFAQHLRSQVYPFLFDLDPKDIKVVADSWGTALWQMSGIECRQLAFRVPRIGEDRLSLVEKYESMAVRTSIPEVFAKYRRAFPLLPNSAEMAASLFRGAAKSGLDLESFTPNVVGVRGFHDNLFHPAEALEKVDAFDTVEEALARLGLN